MPVHPMKHQDKIALVTGAAQGLGLACAERLHAEGAKVFLVDVQADKVRQHAERLGDRAAWWVGDLSTISKAMAVDMVEAAGQRFGGIDILVNNAGIIHLDDFLEFPEHAFDQTQRVNVKAPFLIGQAVGRLMVKQGRGGAIVNMSSINAVLANSRTVAYAVSKGGMQQLTAVMSLSLIPYGIRVNAIGPGTILTELARSSMASPEQRHAILSRTPIGRCGEPSEVASVASFLASDDASYIVGQTIYPDGGRLVLNYTVPVAE